MVDSEVAILLGEILATNGTLVAARFPCSEYIVSRQTSGYATFGSSAVGFTRSLLGFGPERVLLLPTAGTFLDPFTNPRPFMVSAKAGLVVTGLADLE